MKSRSDHQSRTVSLLVLLVMLQLVCRHLLTFLPVPAAEFAWQAADTLRAVGMSATLGLCVTLTPWRNLRLKCLLAATCGYYLSDIALCALWYWLRIPSPIVSGIIQGISFSVAGLFYWYRSYHQPSDDLEPGRLFCVRHIPCNPQDFLISLFGIYGPDGGYSLFADGYLYKFANGRLVRRKVTALPSISYHVIRGSKVTPEMIGELDSMIGMRWTWRKNCLTTLAPIWRKNRG